MFSKYARWISLDARLSAPIVIKKFNIKSFQKAKIKISGLGFYELFLNGKRVGNDFFKPTVSDYMDRDFSKLLYPLKDKTSHSIYYNSFDVSSYLKNGQNTLLILLGNGYFRQTLRTIEGDTSFAKSLICCFDLTIFSKEKESHIFSDGTEKAINSFIVENNLFYGEKHDYKNFDNIFNLTDFSFHKGYRAKTILTPKAKYRLQTCPFDTLQKKVSPKIIYKDKEKTIFDVGENITGYVEIESNGGDLFVRHAENLSNYELDFFSAGGVEQISSMNYLNSKAGSILRPYFSWSAFRYFEIKGNFNKVVVNVVNSNIKVNSSFSCGNNVINWLYKSYIRTQLDNMHCGMPLDCPHRERLGYTGDGQVTCESAMLLLNCKKFYRKWIQDILDCQDIKTGHVQHTAPFFGGGGGPLCWGGAIIIVPYTYYKIYGDISIIKKCYKNMIKFVDYILSNLNNGLVVKEVEGGWCLGDWSTPDKCVIPEPFVNTCYFVYCLNLLEQMLNVIELDFPYKKERKLLISGINNTFFDRETNSYCGGVQGADAFAVFAGFANQNVKNTLVKKYSSLKNFDTGIFGTPILADFLVTSNNLQLLFEILSQTKFPSFGYMKEHGATTLWELWSGESSQNHPMFGGIVKYLFYGFLGISFDAGRRNIRISPVYVKDLGFVEGSIKIKSGTLIVRQEFTAEGTIIKVVNNSKGKIYIINDKEKIICNCYESKEFVAKKVEGEF